MADRGGGSGKDDFTFAFPSSSARHGVILPATETEVEADTILSLSATTNQPSQHIQFIPEQPSSSARHEAILPATETEVEANTNLSLSATTNQPSQHIQFMSEQPSSSARPSGQAVRPEVAQARGLQDVQTQQTMSNFSARLPAVILQAPEQLELVQVFLTQEGISGFYAWLAPAQPELLQSSLPQQGVSYSAPWPTMVQQVPPQAPQQEELQAVQAERDGLLEDIVAQGVQLSARYRALQEQERRQPTQQEVQAQPSSSTRQVLDKRKNVQMGCQPVQDQPNPTIQGMPLMHQARYPTAGLHPQGFPFAAPDARQQFQGFEHLNINTEAGRLGKRLHGEEAGHMEKRQKKINSEEPPGRTEHVTSFHGLFSPRQQTEKPPSPSFFHFFPQPTPSSPSFSVFLSEPQHTDGDLDLNLRTESSHTGSVLDLNLKTSSGPSQNITMAESSNAQVGQSSSRGGLGILLSETEAEIHNNAALNKEVDTKSWQT